MTRRITMAAVAAVGLGFAAACNSRSGPTAAPGLPSPGAEVASGSAPTARPTTAPVAADRVAARDQLRLTVSFLGDDADPTTTVDRVDDAGRVTPNLLGPVAVVGLTEPAAAAAVVKAYAEQRITAKVTVAIVPKLKP